MASYIKQYKKRAYNFLDVRNRGFNVMEVLIVVGIFFVLTAIITSGFSYFRQHTDMDRAVFDTTSLINEARAKSIASEGSSQYGVYFENSRAVLFKGLVFSEPSSDNEEILFPSSVELYDISLSGMSSSTVFKRLTGETDNYGTVSLRLKTDTTYTKTINIEQSGIAEVN